MQQNAYFLAKIGAFTAETEQHYIFAKIWPDPDLYRQSVCSVGTDPAGARTGAREDQAEVRRNHREVRLWDKDRHDTLYRAREPLFDSVVLGAVSQVLSKFARHLNACKMQAGDCLAFLENPDRFSVHFLWYISLGKKSFELQDNLNDFGELSESPDLKLNKSTQKLRALQTRAGREVFWLKSRRL